MCCAFPFYFNKVAHPFLCTPLSLPIGLQLVLPFALNLFEKKKQGFRFYFPAFYSHFVRSTLF